jgi:RNA polymerase sigma factor (sigma-70 family)
MIPINFGSLLQSARKGNQQAWREVVGIVQPYLVRRATRLLGPESQANSFNDLLQDTWGRGFLKINSFKGGADDEETRKKFCIWMGRILERTHSNRLRRGGTRKRKPLRPLQRLETDRAGNSTIKPGKNQPTAPDTSVSKRLKHEDRQRLVREALDTLEPTTRAIVECHLLIDKPMSFREIAEKFGLTIDQVRSRFHASLSRLGPRLRATHEP